MRKKSLRQAYGRGVCRAYRDDRAHVKGDRDKNGREREERRATKTARKKPSDADPKECLVAGFDQLKNQVQDREGSGDEIR